MSAERTRPAPQLTPSRLRFLYASLGIPKAEITRQTGWPPAEVETLLAKYGIRKWDGDIAELGQDEVLAVGALFGNPDLAHVDWGARPGGGRTSDLVREVRLAVEGRFDKGAMDWQALDAVSALVHGIAHARRRIEKLERQADGNANARP